VNQDGERTTSPWNVDIESNGFSADDSLIKGPIGLLSVSFGFVVLAFVALVFDSHWVGYILGVAGSGASIFTAAVDQRRQASVNYSNLNWFAPSVRVVRWSSTLITLVHIFYLARSVGRT
jgi:hypothetical protein